MTKLNAGQVQEIINKKASRRARKKQTKMKVSGSSVKGLQNLIVQKGRGRQPLDKEH